MTLEGVARRAYSRRAFLLGAVGATTAGVLAACSQPSQPAATDEAPWHVVPADNKWFTRIAVASAIVDALEELELAYPKVSDAKKKELADARKLLESKK